MYSYFVRFCTRVMLRFVFDSPRLHMCDVTDVYLQKSKLHGDVKDMQEKCGDEQKQIERLNQLINQSESTVKVS